MRDVVREILAAQREYSPDNTPAMRRRGELVRKDMTAWIRRLLPELREAAGVDDLQVDASDGKGRRSEIPWARVHSASRSPRATDGWYVVYLFDAPGEAVYLTLMQGTTTWKGGSLVTLPSSELRARVAWARGALAPDLARRPDLLDGIDLKGRTGKRAAGYEEGTVAAFGYRADAIPSNEVLHADLASLVSVLGRLYEAVDRALDLPGEPAPEISDAITASARAAGRRGVGQGIRLTAADRLAIERHSVDRALAHLEALGYATRDVGATESYDIDAKRPGEHLHVEVKGTTSPGQEVVLTKNEVDLNAEKWPNTMLIVVSGIHLDRTASPPRASGGSLRVVHPWRVEAEDLTPISYRYRVV